MRRIRTSRAVTAGAVLIALVADAPAAVLDKSAIPAIIRSGDHPGFGRIVIETNASVSYRLEREGDHAIVRLADNLSLGTPPSAPHNVVAIESHGSVLDLILDHDVQLRPTRMDGRIVLDILDNTAPAPKVRPVAGAPGSKSRQLLTMALSPELGGRSSKRASDTIPSQARTIAEPLPVAAQPPPLPVAPSAPSPAVAEAVSATSPAQVAAAVSSVQPAQAASVLRPKPPAPSIVEIAQPAPPGRDVMPENEGPVVLRARRTKLPKGMDGSAFLVPFESTTAAASFREGDSTYIVFDERRPVDMAALADDPAFGATSVRLLTNGTVFRVPHPATLSIFLTQVPQGWRIAELTAAPKLQAIGVSQAEGRINLAAEQPGGVVSMADPDTAATLLVGTQRRPGQAIVTSRRNTEFILRPTAQGVVVEALSDTVALKQVPAGFTLSGGFNGLMLSPPTSTTAALMDASNLTRRFDFSTMAPDVLMRRSMRQLGDAAAAAPLARGLRHHAAAESFIALGLAAEAESLLHMAAEQDPKEAASPTTGALSAIAALLAGRTAEADALLDPRLDGTDEIALWRAVRQAMLDEGSPNAASVFAATAPLVFQYPAPIREHIQPLIIETMILGGQLTPATRLLEQRKDDPRLAYARALMRQTEGDTAEALKLLDAIAGGRDQFDRARAATRAVELRLATHEIDKTQAADALDKLLYAWRGDARELALRQRVADLRGQTGAWRVALSMLRQAETDFPEQAVALRTGLKAYFADMIRDQGGHLIPPIEFVAMIAENTDLMPDPADDQAVEQALAERLLALDLPGRAKPVLEKLLRQAKSAAAKARFGLGLATLESQQGNDEAAIAALDASQTQDLSADLAEQRLILRAGSGAHRGDPAAAAAMLSPAHTARAMEARAQIQEGASDWAGAAQTWSEYAALTLPESGTLEESQIRTVLRLATAASRAGDNAGLAALRDKYDQRIGGGPIAGMFRLLTAEPVRTAADIQRSQQEMSLAASLPANLKALQSGSVLR